MPSDVRESEDVQRGFRRRSTAPAAAHLSGMNVRFRPKADISHLVCLPVDFLFAAGFLCLHRRALHGTVGTKDTAVTGFGPNKLAAVRAGIEELARVSRHRFR